MSKLTTITSTIICLILIVVVAIPIINISTNNPNELDVVIITGQSNAAYRESIEYRVSPTVATEELPIYSGLYYYGTDTSPCTYEVIGSPTYDTTFEEYSIKPMCNDYSYIIGGLEAPLGITIHNRTGHDVLILNVAVAGAPIDWLNPDGTWGTFATGLITNALNEVEGNYSKINKLGWVCLQGEADKTTNVDTYKTKFMKMADYLENFGFNNGYIVPSREQHGGNSIIAQYDLAEQYNNLKIVAANLPNTFTVYNGLLYSDSIHYTEKGRILIGKDVGEQIEINGLDISFTKQAIGILPILLIVSILISIGYSTIKK